MGCIVTVTDKLNIKNSALEAFSSEEAFDSWLLQNETEIRNKIKKEGLKLSDVASPTFMINMTPAEERIDKFEKFKTKMESELSGKNAIGTDSNVGGLITIGATTLFGHAGNKDAISKPVRESGYNKQTFIDYQRTKKGKTAVEAENLWNQQQKLNALRRLDGSVFGALIQDELTGTNKDVSALRKKLKSSDDLRLVGLTVDDIINRVKNNSKYKVVVDAIKRELKLRHGDGYKVYTEFGVVSKELSPEFAAIVKLVSQKLFHKGANAINGYIDIVVLDKDGYVHTYDIKLAKENLSDWWAGVGSNYKYDEVSAQQMAYAVMAKQHGMHFASVNVLGVNEILDDDGNITSMNFDGVQTFGMTNDYAKACYRYFPVHTETDPQSIATLSKTIDELYPGIGLDTAAQTKQISKDFIMKKKVHQASDGKWHMLPDEVFDEWKQYIVKNEIVFNTYEEMERFVANEYVPKMNLQYAKELLGFAEDIRRITKSNRGNRLDSLLETARGISKDRKIQNFIVNKFKKYVIGGWDLVSDADNRLAEYGIFIFAKNGFAEVVMIDKTDLSAMVKLGATGNTTILGNLKNDLSRGTDNMIVLPSTRANLMLMKAMAYISQNDRLFRQFKIQNVQAINLRWGQLVDENLDKLVDNWNLLADLYNAKNKGVSGKTKLKTVGDNQFLSSVQALVQRADDIAETFLQNNINFKGHKENLDARQDDTEEEIRRYMKNLLASDNTVGQTETYAAQSDSRDAYILLVKALLAVRGWNVSVENDQGPFFSNGIFIAGTESLSPAESTSSTIRIFNQIETTYEQRVRDIYNERIRPWQLQMVKVYEENGSAFTNERALFRNCFEKDGDEMSKDFVLIPPDDNPFLKDRPELKKLVEMFLDTLNELRFPDETERLRLKSIPGSMYYQVPLTETNFITQIVQDGLWDAIKRRAKNAFTEVQNYAYGAPMSSYEIEKYNNLDKEEVYDPYLDTSEDAQQSRARMLSGESIDVGNKQTKEYGVDTFEVNLDIVFLKAMASATRRAASREFMPLFTGLRMILEYNAHQTGMGAPEIQESINKFIKSTVFGQLIIKPSNQTVYHILGILRGITSKLTLGLNITSFVKEMTSSTVRTAMSLTEDKYLDGKFNVIDYLSELTTIIFHAHENTDVLSRYNQFNFKFGLANISMEQLARVSKTKFLNPANWEEDLLFENTTMPDFAHRNALLQAYLKKRGSLDAYEMKDGVLTYNMEKDKAFEIYLKYRNNFDAIPDKKTEIKYIEQRRLYEIAFDDWTKHYGYNLEFGDYLPEAISPTEANAIRVYADHLYGNYDPATKSLLQRSLVGSLLLQFKTFGLAQFLQDFRGKGNINITTPHHMTTTDGKKIYRKISTTMEEVDDHGFYKYLTEDDLQNISSEDMSKIQPLIMYIGAPTMGRFMSDMKMTYDVLFHRDEFLENWKNSDVYKSNLYMSLFNNIGMLFIAMLLRLIYGEEAVDNMNEQNWWTRWTYTVLMGVAKDGPVDQVLTGIFTGTPPSISVLQTFFKNAYNIITDNDPALIGFMRLFGATRSFVGSSAG